MQSVRLFAEVDADGLHQIDAHFADATLPGVGDGTVIWLTARISGRSEKFC